MGIDIRLPIGAMFSLLGLLLMVFGLVGPAEIYARSLGVNVNLWWGLCMLVFGGGMLLLGVKAFAQEARAGSSNESA